MKNLFIVAISLTLAACVPGQYERVHKASVSQSVDNPNDIAFSIEVQNNYVTTSSPTLTIDVSKGTPAFYCVMVDSAKLPTEPWSRYTSSNIIANLGFSEGWHDLRVGLLGPDSGSRIAWQWKRMKLDVTPPTLTITNPLASVVVQPILELQGYSSEALNQITYDIHNALGDRTNEDVSISDQYYDSNMSEFTTNYFQAYDVPLALGTNNIVLHATDKAGNTTNVVLNYHYDFSGKSAPVVTLYWPEDGTKISGDFTWRGHLDDFTAKVAATMSGHTEIFEGLVERNGDFWIEHLPEPDGTNSLTLTVTDVAGHVVTKKITVFKSSVRITMNPVKDDLWQDTVTVTGSINATGYTVWVNGVRATIEGTNWTALRVPTTPGGTAVFQTRAILNTEAGESDSTNSPPSGIEK